MLGAFTLLFLFGFVFAYYAGLELLWDGQTVGKRALKLRVLRDNGTPVDAAAVLARTVVRLVDFLPVGYLVGLISMIVDGRARRLGDIVGGTIVVREWDSAPTLREIAVVAEPAAWGPPAPGQEAPVHLLTTDEVAAAREFLRRAATFPPPERAALAWRVATTLAAPHRLPRPAHRPRMVPHLDRPQRGAGREIEHRGHRGHREGREKWDSHSLLCSLCALCVSMLVPFFRWRGGCVLR